MGTTIELNNVGPIEHLSIPVPEGGGVVVLKGPNGSGKTHGIDATASLYDKGVRKSMTKSDGVPSGTITGKGVTVRLGRVNTAKGELECESLDGRVDPSQLVDPGIKDAEKADAKRLAAVVRLGGVIVSPEAWLASLGPDPIVPIENLTGDDPVVIADRIRRAYHKAALELEKESGSKSNQGTTLLESVAELPTEVADADELAKAFDTASEALTVATTRHDSYQESLLAFEGAKEKLAGLPLVDVSGLAEERDHFANLASLRAEEIEEAEKALSAMKADFSELESSHTLAVQKLDAANEQESARLSLKAVLEAGLPKEVTRDEIGKLTLAKSEARTAIQNAEVVRRGIETRNNADKMLELAEAAAAKAVKYRDVARSTDAVLEQALVDAGFEAVKIHDGRLCVASDRGLEPFSELSHGERWRMALDFAAQGLPEGSVLPVAQEAYEALDPSNRQQIAELAKERGLVIVTALASDGDLRAEVVSL